MNTNTKMQKLQLNRETLTTLDIGRLAGVRGGFDDGGDGGGAQPMNERFSNNVWNCSSVCGVTR